jgi:hypothetical protein
MDIGIALMLGFVIGAMVGVATTWALQRTPQDDYAAGYEQAKADMFGLIYNERPRGR